MESERTVRLAPGHLVRVKRTGMIGVVSWVDRDRLEEPWVMLGVWVMEPVDHTWDRGAHMVRRRFPAVDVEPADPDTLAEVAVEGVDSLKRFQWDVGSGDPVRFAATGEVGVVADVGPGTAMVWVLEWVGLKVPRLVRRQCAVDGIGLATIANHKLEPDVPAVPVATRRCDALVIDALGRVARWRPVDCPVAFSICGPPQARECAPMGCRHCHDSGQEVNCMATCQRAVNYNTMLWCQHYDGRGAMELLGRVVYDEREARERIEADFDADGQVAIEATVAEKDAPPRVMALAIAEDGRRVGRIRHQATDPAWVAEMRRRGVSELRHVGPFAVEPLLCQRQVPAEACVLACVHLLRLGDHCECQALGWRGLILSDGSTGWRRYDLWVGADDLVEAPGWPVYLKGKEEGA